MDTIGKAAAAALGRRTTTASWVDAEVRSCTLTDARLEARLKVLLSQQAQRPGASLPMVCQDWAHAKAAYRFLDNARVTDAQILAGHFAATAERVTACAGPVLVLHDTTEFSFERSEPRAIGMLGKQHQRGAYVDGRPQQRTVCGLEMHSSLVVTPEGLPLGLAAVKFFTRSRFHGANALKRTINPTRVPIEVKESYRWLENVRDTNPPWNVK